MGRNEQRGTQTIEAERLTLSEIVNKSGSWTPNCTSMMYRLRKNSTTAPVTLVFQNRSTSSWKVIMYSYTRNAAGMHVVREKRLKSRWDVPRAATPRRLLITLETKTMSAGVRESSEGLSLHLHSFECIRDGAQGHMHQFRHDEVQQERDTYTSDSPLICALSQCCTHVSVYFDILQRPVLAISIAQVSWALALTSTSSTWRRKLIGIQVHLGRRDGRRGLYSPHKWMKRIRCSWKTENEYSRTVHT